MARLGYGYVMSNFDKFLFGTASSSQQVEGGNDANQFVKFEHQGYFPQAGSAVDFYNCYEEDILLAKELGLNAMRIQIEWSRVMPLPGEVNMDAVNHYAKILQFMRAQNIEPIITLFHWTYPAWLEEKFYSKEFIEAFETFVQAVIKNLKVHDKYWLIINEPEVFAFEIIHHGTGKSKAIFKRVWQSLNAYLVLLKMHKRSYKIIKCVDSGASVGIAKNVAYHEPFRQNNILDNFLISVANFFGNELFIHLIAKQLDFIGLNYYFYHNLKFSWSRLFERQNKFVQKSDMGEKTYPKGLYYLCKQFAKFNMPILITENGIANAHDQMRVRFIKEHLNAIKQARHEGINVFGYLYWSLTDTYEWKSGYDLKFGLVEVDLQTQARRIRKKLDIDINKYL